MIECIRGSGGCNGWVHPSCCGLILTQEELEAIDSYICPLCERPDDDYTSMKALNTKLANRLAKRERKKTLLAATAAATGGDEGQPKRKRAPAVTPKPWVCAFCSHANPDRKVKECEACHQLRKPVPRKPAASKEKVKEKSKDKPKKKVKESLSALEDSSAPVDRRRSHREGNKKRKSYHVPDSDEDLGSSTDEERHGRHKSRGSKRPRAGSLDGESGTESDEAEYIKKKKSKPDPAEQQGALPAMVIEKIMGVRQRDITEPAPPPPAGSASASIFANRPTTVTLTEYLIKWKGFSFMHCTWETKEVLLDLDPLTNKQRIKRFHEKDHHHHHRKHHHHRSLEEEMEAADELEYFNPEYLEIQRIIAHRQDEPMPADPNFPDAPVDDGVRYFVKWRVLPYTDATWERACDLKDDVALDKFRKSIAVPPFALWEPRPHPTIRDYRKLDESPRFGEDQSLLLRGYQLEGLNWLLWNWYNERPSILADEMGLGKTIQTLAFLDRLRESDKIMCRGPFLIVAPLSLIMQWQNECETWTTMNCIVYHGNGDSREIIRDFEFYYLDENNQPDKQKPFRFNILVTTYEVAIKDISILSKIRWRCLIVDEAHRLKNQSSRLVEQLRSLRRDHCVLLTGTPLQNKTEELWALLNFLDPRSFPSVSDFLEKFGDLHEAQQVADLHKMLKPYLLRRVKEDVEKALPPKEETIIEVELTPVQKQWYRAIYERNTTFLNRSGNPHNIPNLMNVMMELRKCCNHPYLNNGVEDVLNEGLQSDAQRHEMMVKCCGKMVLLDKLLPRLKEDGHKVLIFSQMVRVLDIIEDYLRYVGHLYERLDGNIRGNDRQAAVDRFVKPEYNRFVMLLSTKAGGLGLNLTAADTVIIFDSDWNPQNDLQAQARAHRIGQTHSVKIYRLITRKTYEMHMFHKASLKLGLDKAVLTHMRRENEDLKDGKKKMSKAQESKEIDELLKRGAYDVFRDDDTEGEQFCAADIDQILQRSSQIVQYEQQAKSSFSKASFVSATTSDDVDIDDPDFWKKAVGLTEPDPSEADGNLPLQRKRTRVARFGANADFDSDEDTDEFDKEFDKKDRDKDAGDKSDEKKEVRDWTLNGRDRLQRALMHYGFGRWEIIRSQSGGSRSVDEVERFAREFIYVSGLSSTDAISSSSKDDSAFVKASIRASVYAQRENLINEEELPVVLKDEDFVVKLKQGGGRRVLIRLDMLFRLQRLIGAACDACDAEYAAQTNDPEEGVAIDGSSSKPSPPPPTADVDERVSFYGVDKIASHVKVADVGERPSWTQITPWWNGEADRNLLLGVFLHGYGRCAQIIGDARLYFAKAEQAAKDQAASTGGNTADVKVVVEPESAVPKKAGNEDMDLSDAESEGGRSTSTADDDDGNDTKTSSGQLSEGSLAASESANQKTSGSGTKKSDSGNDGFKQPEVQQMNRLLFWLLSADDIKKQKEQEAYKKERVALEQQRQAALDHKQRRAALRRLEIKAKQLVQLDMLRQFAWIDNARQMPESTVATGQKIKQKDWTKDERRTFSYLLALHGAPHILAKQAIDGSPLPFVAEHPRPFSWQTDSISWTNLVRWGKLNKTAELARAFYEDKFLPRCREIAAMKADPLASDQRAVALGDLIGIEFVDANEGVLAHGLKARNVAWVTLRRSQLLQDILEVLSMRQPALVALLRSGAPELVEGMPVWWCPWIHDLGLFYGMARYGVAGWERILLDRELPFHRTARERHIRQVFLEGSPTLAPLYRHLFDSTASMDAWLARVLDELPSLAILELKVQNLCAHVLEIDHLPDTGTRYVEPDARREFSLPQPGNCIEELVVALVREQEALPPAAALPSGGAFPSRSSDKAESSDAALRTLMAACQVPGDGDSQAQGQQENDSEAATASSSQIPIQMLVS